MVKKGHILIPQGIAYHQNEILYNIIEKAVLTYMFEPLQFFVKPFAYAHDEIKGLNLW